MSNSQAFQKSSRQVISLIGEQADFVRTSVSILAASGRKGLKRMMEKVTLLKGHLVIESLLINT
jgi:hypothetical protein